MFIWSNWIPCYSPMCLDTIHCCKFHWSKHKIIVCFYVSKGQGGPSWICTSCHVVMSCWPLYCLSPLPLFTQSCVIKQKTESPCRVCVSMKDPCGDSSSGRVCVFMCLSVYLCTAMRQQWGCQPSCHSSSRCALDPCLSSKCTCTHIHTNGALKHIISPNYQPLNESGNRIKTI